MATERLILQPFSNDWVESLRLYQLRNAVHLAPWEALRAADFFESEVFARRAQGWLAAAQVGQVLRWVITLPQAPENVIGTVNFSQIVGPPFQACTLGYSTDAAHTGQRYMQEALRTLLPTVSQRLSLHRIQANHIPGNLASAAVLKALGFETEGLAKSYLQIAGRFQDHVLTAWTNPEIAPALLG